MSLEDAEIFVSHIQKRLGRFPILYTNGVTALHIAQNRDRYRLLSRLPLWYARYKPEIGLHFPKGNWERYTLWQFSAGANCDAKACPYRVPGTSNDIDVNVASMSADELRAEWPFGGLVDTTIDMIATVPVPISRSAALKGDVTLQFAEVEEPAEPAAFASMFPAAGRGLPVRVSLGKPAETLRQVEYANYVDVVEKTRKLARAMDEDFTGPAAPVETPLAVTPLPGFARNDFPVFLIRKLDAEVGEDQ